MATQVELVDKLRSILDHKVANVHHLIKDAVRSGIHVDILVCCKEHVQLAKHHLKRIGVHDDKFDVLADLPESQKPDHLQLKFDNLLMK